MLSLYNFFKKDNKKERFDIILEPLQAMVQLALLAFCPKGSKLTITNNLLSIQLPTWRQSIDRSYNHDKRDDVYYLFNAIMRFNKFYLYLKTDTKEENRLLFGILIKLGKLGIDNILLTYSNIEQPSLLHTLQMYRSILDNPELFSDLQHEDRHSKKNIDDVFIEICKLYTINEFSIIYNTFVLLEKRPEHFEMYMAGLNALMDHINIQIKKWINDNIIY